MAYTLQQLSDIEEIKRVKAKYFRLMDYKEWDALKDVFAEDFRYEMIDPKNGRTATTEEIGRDAYMVALMGVLDGVTTTHHGHMMEVELTGADTADCITALQDIVDLHKYGVSQRGEAHYVEKWKRCSDGKWRIHRMSIRYLRLTITPLPKGSEYKPHPDFEALSTIF